MTPLPPDTRLWTPVFLRALTTLGSGLITVREVGAFPVSVRLVPRSWCFPVVEA